jgi:hypothetical protein
MYVGKRFSSLEDGEFNQLFLDFRYTCYRLETLQRYDVSYEKEEYGHFLAGENQGESRGIASWIDGTVSKAVAAGKQMQRVHVIEEPLSDYLRYEFGWAYEHTVAAGEDVRLIPVSAGQWPDKIPHYDYWLFDSSILVAMYYECDGAFSAAELIDDPEKIVRANYWRDMAVVLSVPFHSYAASRQPPDLRR